MANNSFVFILSLIVIVGMAIMMAGFVVIKWIVQNGSYREPAIAYSSFAAIVVGCMVLVIAIYATAHSKEQTRDCHLDVIKAVEIQEVDIDSIAYQQLLFAVC